MGHRIMSSPLMSCFFAMLLLFQGAKAAEVVVTRHAVIREQPHGYAPRRGTAEPGERFRLQSQTPTDNWYLIDYQGQEGWIYSRRVDVIESVQGQTVRIASFNTLHLGWGSSKDLELVATVLADFDVVALQEVMKGDALTLLVSQLELVSTQAEGINIDWNSTVSEKIGRSRYKEAYAFVWRTDRVQLVPQSTFVVNDVGDRFMREPYVASFISGNFDFTLVSAHFIYGDRKADRQIEARAIDDVYQYLQDSDMQENDVILLGDFNLTPSDQSWQGLKDITGMTWVLDAPARTTIGKTGMSNLYDNIWFQSQHTAEFSGEGGSYEFMHDLFETDVFESARRLVSDHVPVYAVFRTDLVDDD